MPQLTANTNNTESMILSLTPWSQADNPSGAQDGEFYFANDTKKLFLARVLGADASGGGSLSWRVVDSSAMSGGEVDSAIMQSKPTLWVDSQNNNSIKGSVGDSVDALMDVSGNDFHSIQWHNSHMFYLGQDETTGIKYLDKGNRTATYIKYRQSDPYVKKSGLRVGQAFKINNHYGTMMFVFKLRQPFMTAGPGAATYSGGFSGNYEDANNDTERSLCVSPSGGPNDNLHPFHSYYLGMGKKYVSTTYNRGGSQFYNNAFWQHFVNCPILYPKAGSFNNCHEKWGTIMTRSTDSGYCQEFLINGKQSFGLSPWMRDGAEKFGLQKRRADPADADYLSGSKNVTWEKNSATEFKTTFMTGAATSNHVLPWVEQTYENVAMDGNGTGPGNAGGQTAASYVDFGLGYAGGAGPGAADDAANFAVNCNSGYYNGGGSGYYAYWPHSTFYNGATEAYDGRTIPAPIQYGSEHVAPHLASNYTDFACSDLFDYCEVLIWNRRLSDQERNDVLAEIHDKYQQLGGDDAIPDLPNDTGVSDKSIDTKTPTSDKDVSLMPSKTNIFGAPWI